MKKISLPKEEIDGEATMFIPSLKDTKKDKTE